MTNLATFPSAAEARRRARVRRTAAALILQEVSAIDLVKGGFARQLALREKYYRNPNISYEKENPDGSKKGN